MREWLRLDNTRKLWTGAFVVSSFSFGIYRADKERFHDKLSRVADLISRWATLILPLATKLETMIATKGTTSEEISQALYQGLRTCPGVGPFNAYQVAVDVGYWRKDLFDEDVFTVAGPGAINGATLCFESYTFPASDGLKDGPQRVWLRSKDREMEEQNALEKKMQHNGSTNFKQKKRKRRSQPKPPYERLIAILVKEVNTVLLQELSGISPKELFYDRPEGKRYVNLMAMENCMCELSKYVRETGRNGRCRYPGGADPAGDGGDGGSSSTSTPTPRTNSASSKLAQTVRKKYQHTSSFLPPTPPKSKKLRG
jgi:hypothetical protein